MNTTKIDFTAERSHSANVQRVQDMRQVDTSERSHAANVQRAQALKAVAQ
jgi:flagellar basal body rod protein FlgC